MASEYDEPEEHAELEPDIYAYGPKDEQTFTPESLLLVNSTIEQIPEFIELVRELKTALTNPDTDPGKLKQLWNDYDQLFKNQADNPDNKAVRDKIQILTMFRKALIFRDIGNILRYLEELDTVIADAMEFGFEEFAKLDAEIDAYAPSLEPSAERLILGLRGILTNSDREDLRTLWQMEYNATNLVYRVRELLLAEGEDPDSILESLGVDEHYWASQ